MENLSEACDTLVHRGPDDRGLWMDKTGQIGLGHRRLSILDLSSAGRQPMISACSQFIVVFNGEIYNFKELRNELESRRHTFRSQTDTEVLLAAYATWGESVVTRLRGMFAFLIYDIQRRLFFMARDRAGEKPFYYWHTPQGFAFASELKAIMSLPGCPRRLDLTSLPHYFAYGYAPAERSLLEGIRKLPPAHAATYSPERGLNTWRYWETPAHSGNRQSEEDFEQRMEELLMSSVTEQLVADVPVGILLSGGTDSGLVAAAAARAGAGSLNTYTVVFPEFPCYDESKHARLVAAHIGSRHHELEAEPSSFDVLPDLARQFDEPVCDSSMIPMHLVSRLVRKQCTVALGGDGGDELFAGYQGYGLFARQESVAKMLTRPVARLISAASESLLPFGTRWRGRLIWLNPDMWSNGVARASKFDPDSRSRLLSVPIKRSLRRAPEEYRMGLGTGGFSLLQKATRVDFRTYLPEDILAKVDRASMLASLEVRAPFLDHRIIEFAFGEVPDSLKYDASIWKVLPKRLARKWLPPEFDIGRKQGFAIPLREWMNGPWRNSVQDILAEAPQELFRAKFLGRLLAMLPSHSVAEQVYSICLFELWRRQYRIVI